MSAERDAILKGLLREIALSDCEFALLLARCYLGNFSRERSKVVVRELTERSPYQLETTLSYTRSLNL
jgi:hypothetical protein